MDCWPESPIWKALRCAPLTDFRCFFILLKCRRLHSIGRTAIVYARIGDFSGLICLQGEENQIVIVSLVRSNPGGRIGHLSMRNRLCVAVSRARSGVYLCGDNTTLSRASHWRTLIGFFESKKSLTPCISLCCPRHPQEPPYSLSFLDVANFTPSEVCKKPCKAELDCGHFCSSTCHTGDHCQCKENVPFTVDQCGHTGVKLCHVDAKGILCETKIIFTFEGCGHTTQCECWKTWKTGSLKCQFVCGRFLPGCGHACTLLCSEDCAGAPCKACLIIQEEKAKIQRQLRRELIERKREELAMDIKRLQDLGDEGILVTEVHPDDETAKDFYMVCIAGTPSKIGSNLSQM